MDIERAVAVSHLTFLRAGEKHSLYRAVPSLDALLLLSRDDIGDIIGRPLRTRAWDPGDLGPRARRDAAFLAGRGVSLIAFGDAAYPPWLAETYDPPFLLFAVGAPLRTTEPMLAVVGTRAPTAGGRSAARELGRDAAARGLPVVSGLARGIDTEAHRGALEGRGVTIAVLGCGIDIIYPAANRMLAQQIAESGGTILSEYPPGTPPRQFNFPERNRIISGLARGTVVVEAPERSGALITADYALEQGRDLFVHAVSMKSPRGAGARALSADGAGAVSGAGEIAAEWGVGAGDVYHGGSPGRAAAGGDWTNPAGAGRSTGMQLALELEAELAGGGNG